MTTHVLVGKAGSNGITHSLIDSMLRLRCDVFKGRLDWDVQVSAGRESDWYDAIGPYYVIATDAARSRCLGCCRLLPSTGPNMLRDIFASLLSCEQVPAHSRAWEVSRFAISADVGGTFGFGDVPAAMIRALVGFSVANDVDALIGVTTTPFSRLMRGIGFDIQPLGETRQIGNARTMAFNLPLTLPVLVRLGVLEHREAA